MEPAKGSSIYSSPWEVKGIWVCWSNMKSVQGDVKCINQNSSPCRSNLEWLCNCPCVLKAPTCRWTTHTIAFEWLEMFPAQTRGAGAAAWAAPLCRNGNQTLRHEPRLKRGQNIAWRTGGCRSILVLPTRTCVHPHPPSPEQRGPREAAEASSFNILLHF